MVAAQGRRSLKTNSIHWLILRGNEGKWLMLSRTLRFGSADSLLRIDFSEEVVAEVLMKLEGEYLSTDGGLLFC
jgi:hypothetical protein